VIGTVRTHLSFSCQFD